MALVISTSPVKSPSGLQAPSTSSSLQKAASAALANGIRLGGSTDTVRISNEAAAQQVMSQDFSAKQNIVQSLPKSTVLNDILRPKPALTDDQRAYQALRSLISNTYS